MFINVINGDMVDRGDLVYNGRGQGDVGALMSDMMWEPGLMRPYVEDRPNHPDRGRPCAVVNSGRYDKDGRPIRIGVRIEKLEKRGIHSPVFNTTTLLRQAWVQIDAQIVKEFRKPLTAWSDLVGANSVGGFDAMSKLTFEYDYMSDPGEIVEDMDAIADGRRDSPLFGTASVPLPITHSDFWYSKRRLAVARQTKAPLDTVMGEACGRRIGEHWEKKTIGTVTQMTYGTRSTGPDPHRGTSTGYGYTSFPYRTTKTDLTTPTGTNPEAVMTDVLEMIETFNTNGIFGPFWLYHSTAYSRYLNDDYFRSGSTSAVRTLRERLQEIDQISIIKRLDFLTSGYQLIMVKPDSSVCAGILGMDVTTIQWPTKGGLMENFKVMGIGVPLMKAPYSGATGGSGICGIQHGTTS